MSLYSQNILEHYKDPVNKWKIEGPSIQSTSANRSCWDEITVYIVVQNEIIKELKFEWVWCAISMATADILAEELVWSNVNEISLMWLADIEDLVGIKMWANRIKCALLALEAIKSWIKTKTNKSDSQSI